VGVNFFLFFLVAELTSLNNEKIEEKAKTELDTGRVDLRVGSGRVWLGRITVFWNCVGRIGSGPMCPTVNIWQQLQQIYSKSYKCSLDLVDSTAATATSRSMVVKQLAICPRVVGAGCKTDLIDLHRSFLVPSSSPWLRVGDLDVLMFPIFVCLS